MGNGESLESFSEIWYPWPLDRTPVSLVHAKDGVLGLPTTDGQPVRYGPAPFLCSPCATTQPSQHTQQHRLYYSTHCIGV